MSYFASPLHDVSAINGTINMPVQIRPRDLALWDSLSIDVDIVDTMTNSACRVGMMPVQKLKFEMHLNRACENNRLIAR